MYLYNIDTFCISGSLSQQALYIARGVSKKDLTLPMARKL